MSADPDETRSIVELVDELRNLPPDDRNRRPRLLRLLRRLDMFVTIHSGDASIIDRLRPLQADVEKLLNE